MFDRVKSWEKARTATAREGLSIPCFYIHLAELEDSVKEQWEDKEVRKTMSKQNSNALAKLRQNLKKYNKDFEEQLAAYKEGPDPFGYSSGAAEDNEEDEDEL